MNSDLVREKTDFTERNPELARRYKTLENEIVRTKKKLSKKKISTTEQNELERQLARLERQQQTVGNTFVELNYGLVSNEVRAFANSNVDVSDYYAAGLSGLWDAFLKWDPERGVQFSTFSHFYITGALHAAVRGNEFQHLSQTDFNQRAAARKAQRRLVRKLGRTPDMKEIAEEAELPEEKITRLLGPGLDSLDRQIGGDEQGASLKDLFEEENLAVPDDLPNFFEKFLIELNPTEYWIIESRSGRLGGANQSLVEVGALLGIGREIIRRQEMRAKTKLAGAYLQGNNYENMESHYNEEELVEVLQSETDTSKVALLTGFTEQQVEDNLVYSAYDLKLWLQRLGSRRSDPLLLFRFAQEFGKVANRLVQTESLSRLVEESSNEEELARKLLSGLLYWDERSEQTYLTFMKNRTTGRTTQTQNTNDLRLAIFKLLGGVQRSRHLVTL